MEVSMLTKKQQTQAMSEIPEAERGHDGERDVEKAKEANYLN